MRRQLISPDVSKPDRFLFTVETPVGVAFIRREEGYGRRRPNPSSLARCQARTYSIAAPDQTTQEEWLQALMMAGCVVARDLGTTNSVFYQQPQPLGEGTQGGPGGGPGAADSGSDSDDTGSTRGFAFLALGFANRARCVGAASTVDTPFADKQSTGKVSAGVPSIKRRVGGPAAAAAAAMATSAVRAAAWPPARSA